MTPSPAPEPQEPWRPADAAAAASSGGRLERLLAERLARAPARPEFAAELGARFVAGFGAAEDAAPGEVSAADANQAGAGSFGRLEAELGRRLREGLPSARPAFARALEERFLAAAPAGDERALPVLPMAKSRPRYLLPVSAALALAAALMLWASLTRPSAALRFEPVRAQGARYAGAPLEAPFVAQPGGLLEVGEDPLRLKLGGALRLFLAAGSQVEIELPCALRSGCIEACLALEAEREAVVVADEREYRVEVTLETAQARVVLFGAEASVKPCADGTCIVIQSGRARVEPRLGPPVELSAGQRLFVGGDGRIDLDREYLKRAEDPAVAERVGNLRRSLAEVAEGVF
jgi:hypothetical protein